MSQGNVALCGLRKGAIVTVDVRQRQRHLARHSFVHPSDNSKRPGQKTTKKFVVNEIEIKDNSFIFYTVIFTHLAIY